MQRACAHRGRGEAVQPPHRSIVLAQVNLDLARTRFEIDLVHHGVTEGTPHPEYLISAVSGRKTGTDDDNRGDKQLPYYQLIAVEQIADRYNRQGHGECTCQAGERPKDDTPGERLHGSKSDAAEGEPKCEAERRQHQYFRHEV